MSSRGTPPPFFLFLFFIFCRAVCAVFCWTKAKQMWWVIYETVGFLEAQVNMQHNLWQLLPSCSWNRAKIRRLTSQTINPSRLRVHIRNTDPEVHWPLDWHQLYFRHTNRKTRVLIPPLRARQRQPCMIYEIPKHKHQKWLELLNRSINSKVRITKR